MISYTCDICNRSAVYRSGYDFELDKSLPKIPGCHIVVTTRLHFKDHPTGFGGPPDLCDECFATALESTLNYIKKELKRT